MKKSACLALLLAFALSYSLASSASANSVPTHGRSSYGDQGSTIESTSSYTVDGVSLNGQSFCSFSESSGAECALSFAYEITSALPSGATSVTITVPVPAGSSLLSSSPISFGILTNDDGGSVTSPDLFYSPSLTEAGILGLPNGDITYGLDGSGNPFITINDLSLAPNLAIFMDLSDNAAPFGDSHFCSDSTNTTCTYDIPSLTAPEITLTAAQKTVPEPGTLLSLLSGLSLLGFVRRRSNG